MQLFDNNQNQICSTSYSIPQGEFQETMSISISGWKLVDTFSSDAIYKDIYDLRVFTFMVSAFYLSFVWLQLLSQYQFN